MSDQAQHDDFQLFQYQGADAEKFLQGQVTCNVSKITDVFLQTAICDLKGRIHFSLWLRRRDAETFDLVVPSNVADEFASHIRKFGAFSKATLSPATPVFAVFKDQQIDFSPEASDTTWQQHAILQGEAWIDQKSQHLFQPQELRLHQRGGVDYDKGCYLGQEVVARLWFKAKPKQWLHAIHSQQSQLPCVPVGEFLAEHIQLVNVYQQADEYWALVVAKPDAIQTLVDENRIRLLNLPEHLQGSVARNDG